MGEDVNHPTADQQQAAAGYGSGLPPKYPLSTTQVEEANKRFTYHPPKGDQASRYVALRDEAKVLAWLIMESTPASREQSLALTKLEEAIFWANASIARNE